MNKHRKGIENVETMKILDMNLVTPSKVKA
jgi:hypothetical protein